MNRSRPACRAGAACVFIFCAVRVAVLAQSNYPPALSIAWATNQTVALAWSNAAPGFILQSSDSLPAFNGWQGVLQTPLLQGGQLVVTQALSSITGPARFF